MTITRRNGQTTEALLLSRSDQNMRIVLKGSDDTCELSGVSGERLLNREAVRVQFAWEGNREEAVPEAAECVCSPELANRLIEALFDRSREPQLEAGRSYFSAGSLLC
jgi:hypothetical protein